MRTTTFATVLVSCCQKKTRTTSQPAREEDLRWSVNVCVHHTNGLWRNIPTSMMTKERILVWKCCWTNNHSESVKKADKIFPSPTGITFEVLAQSQAGNEPLTANFNFTHKTVHHFFVILWIQFLSMHLHKALCQSDGEWNKNHGDQCFSKLWSISPEEFWNANASLCLLTVNVLLHQENCFQPSQISWTRVSMDTSGVLIWTNLGPPHTCHFVCTEHLNIRPQNLADTEWRQILCSCMKHAHCVMCAHEDEAIMSQWQTMSWWCNHESIAHEWWVLCHWSIMSWWWWWCNHESIAENDTAMSWLQMMMVIMMSHSWSECTGLNQWAESDLWWGVKWVRQCNSGQETTGREQTENWKGIKIQTRFSTMIAV